MANEVFKTTLFIILICHSFIAKAHWIDSLGIDQAVFLNKHESKYFNELFNSELGKFNFFGAKVLFVTGSSGNRIVH